MACQFRILDPGWFERSNREYTYCFLLVKDDLDILELQEPRKVLNIFLRVNYFELL